MIAYLALLDIQDVIRGPGYQVHVVGDEQQAPARPRGRLGAGLQRRPSPFPAVFESLPFEALHLSFFRSGTHPVPWGVELVVDVLLYKKEFLTRRFRFKCSPSIRTDPIPRQRPVTHLHRVDFPAPLGPAMARMLPPRAEKEMSDKIWRPSAMQES